MNKDNIKKNGVPLSKDGYRLGPTLAEMTTIGTTCWNTTWL